MSQQRNIIEEFEDLPYKVIRETGVGDTEPRVDSEKLSLTIRRLHERLSNEAELLRLHLKHYHMPLVQFKKRTSHLKIPQEVYEKYKQVATNAQIARKLT